MVVLLTERRCKWSITCQHNSSPRSQYMMVLYSILERLNSSPNLKALTKRLNSYVAFCINLTKFSILRYGYENGKHI